MLQGFKLTIPTDFVLPPSLWTTVYGLASDNRKEELLSGRMVKIGGRGTDQRHYKRRAPGEGWRDIAEMKDLQSKYF